MHSDLPTEINRRTLLQQGVAIAAAVSGLATVPIKSLGAVDVSPGWIDAHVHVWSSDTKKYPLSERLSESDMKPRSFTANELFAHCRPTGVQRIVLIQMSFYQYDHTYMCEVMQAHPGVFSGVALIDHRSDKLLARIDELAALGMRGFRLHSRGDAAGWVDDPGMAQLWTRAGERGLAVCPLINPADIPVVAKLCERFPQTTTVVDHFARVGINGQVEENELQSLCDLAKFPNTHVKTSAFYALGKKAAPYNDLVPMIRRVYDSFGPERLMWASDCPFQVQADHSYEASISLIRDRCEFLSDSDKQWLLRQTAEKVYFA